MFIDFEGIDGSGKTTLSNLLAQRLLKEGYRVLHAREGGELKSPTARRLRELTRDATLLEMSARTEFFLNVARDAQQLEEVIRPALARGELCIADRYLYSQLALSHGGRGLQDAPLWRTVELAAQGVWPDLVILVDVDPELARLRKRVGKLRSRGERPEVGSRKGLAGAGMNVRVREAFLAMARADPSRWLVVENNEVELPALAERIFEAVLARLQGRPLEAVRAQASGERPVPTLQTLETAFFAAVDDLELREPRLSAFMLSGIPGLAAHQRRLRQVEAEPEVVARSLAGLLDPESFELRNILAELAPEAVVRSLGSEPSEPAMALRERLFERAPSAALAGLRFNDGEGAWALRERALAKADEALGEVLWGMAGVDSARAWDLRVKGLREGLYAECARSLHGLSGEAPDALREQLYPVERLAVLRSLSGQDGPLARRLREELFPMAPKWVLRSLSGVDSEHADRLRALAAQKTKEALDSVDGLDSPAAWALRERYATTWPSTAISSLRQLALTARGQALIERVLAAFPGRITVLRSAWATLSRAPLLSEQVLSARPWAAAAQLEL
jgi:dTMP kinase